MNTFSRWRRCICAAAGGLLLGDALLLMARGQFNVGVTLPLLLGLAWCMLAWRWAGVHGWLLGKPVRLRVWRLLWIMFWLWLLSLFAFWGWLGVQGANEARPADVRAIIVLGSATRDGQPSPALAMRLDAAAAAAARWPGALIVTSGGVDWGQRESEAEVMAAYLEQRHGLPAARMRQEGESTSTDLNLQLSARVLAASGIDVRTLPVAVVTSDFHTLRAAGIARRQAYAQPVMVGAPTPLATRFNAWLREYFAVASSWVLGEI